MDLAYCRVSTTAQDLDRQIDAMRDAGVAEEHVYVDKRTRANMEREGLRALLGFARPGDRINVLTLDRLGRNMRETLNLVHDLTERSVFLRTLGDKLAVDTSEPGLGTDMAIALLAMFAQMERIYMLGTCRRCPRGQGSPRPADRPPREAQRDHPRWSRPTDQGWRDPRASRRRTRRQPLHALPGTAQAPRRRRCRTCRAGRLINEPDHIRAGQGNPLFFRRLLRGPPTPGGGTGPAPDQRSRPPARPGAQALHRTRGHEPCTRPASSWSRSASGPPSSAV
ncbi:hypothetical protein M2271_006769 [Streptomyces sp. LBL]|nr:hypothetical protein [Streptomyces sp. LBL]